MRYKRNAMIKKYVYTDIIIAWKHAPSSYTYATTYTYQRSAIPVCRRSIPIPIPPEGQGQYPIPILQSA